jgi:flagellar P-ring protein precursor FlgI
LLLLTPLFAADGQAYAATQGPITLGGYSAGQGGTGQRVNHPTVGRIPEGAIIERSFGVELSSLSPLHLLLREPDFTSAANVAAAVNRSLGEGTARVADSRLVEIDPDRAGRPPAEILAAIENLPVEITPPSRVVINERTGTVVMGRDVKLGAVSVLHGNLTIETTTVLEVSQPGSLSSGETVVAPQTGVRAEQAPARRLELESGASVEDLVRGLQAIGANARDIVAILQAIKAAGGLQAELEII